MKHRVMTMGEDHKRFETDIKAAMQMHVGNLSGEEMLAIVSQVLGQLIALQGQRTMTPDRAMAIVAANIEEGNRTALADLAKTEGRA